MAGDSGKVSAEQAIKTTVTMLGWLPQLAGLVIVFTALAYLTGRREAVAFYRELGAPWVTALLTSAQVMQTSIWLISLITLTALVSIFLMTQGAIGQRGLRRWSIFFCLLAVLCFFIPWLWDKHFSRSASDALLGAVGFFWALMAGTTIGELVACLTLNKLKWGDYHAFLLYFAVMYGLLHAPTLMGQSRGKLSDDTANSSLPKIILKAAEPAGEWRLVGPVGNHLLLVMLAPRQEDRRFRLVEPTDVSFISAQKRKSTAPDAREEVP